MRRAEWRGRADDPKNLIGWWWRSVTETRFLGLRVFLILSSVVLIVAQSHWGMVPLALNFAFKIFEARCGRPDDLQPLLPDPPALGEFRARVSYHRDGMTTGTDEMALLFVDGWLVAEGVCSHFALRGIDVGRITGMGDLTIRLPLADGSDVRLQNIRDREGRVHVPHALFKAWQKQAEVTEGEPTLPPRFVHPKVFSYWIAWLVCGFVVAAIPNATKLFLDIREVYKIPFLLVGSGIAFYSGRRIFRLTDLLIGAGKEARERLPEGASMSVDVMGRRVTISGEARLSPETLLAEVPIGEAPARTLS